MVQIGDRPILWHIMKHYASYGHRDFVLCLGHLGEVIKDYFLHYESRQNDVTVDRWAVGSDVSQLAAIYGDAYANVELPSLASPLDGGYQVVPLGDIDHDGTVTTADLDLLLAAWGPCPVGMCAADLDGDGVVGILDFLTLLGNW